MIVAGEASGDLHGATLCRALRVAGARPPPGGDGGRADGRGRGRARGRRHRGRRHRRHRGLRSAGHALSRVAPTDGRPARPEPPRRRRGHRLPRVQSAAGPRGPARRDPGGLLHSAAGVGVAAVADPCDPATRVPGAGGAALRGRALRGRRRSRGVRRSPRARRRRRAPSREEAAPRLAVPPEATVLGLLPGSRAQEIVHTLPVLRAAADRIAGRVPAPAWCWRSRRRWIARWSSGCRGHAAGHHRDPTPTRSCARPISCW